MTASLKFLVPLITALGFSGFAMAVDEPPHTVIEKDGKIEIRRYAPMILAEVTVTGNMQKAGNSGFKTLADYIFGNNKPAEKIAMTAPVTRTESTKIKMSAPVTRVANDDQSWTVAFVMPAKWTMKTLPRPNNPSVSIREVAAQTLAAFRFSGRADDADFQRKFVELKNWLDTHGYEVTGEPRFAGYNSPFMPGPFRRNEVMVPVQERTAE